MSGKVSAHLPETAGGIETVTGTLVVDTGLRQIQGGAASMAQAHDAGSAGVSITFADKVAGQSIKATLAVWEDDGTTASSAATTVSWFALGK